MLKKETQEALKRRMMDLDIRDCDLVEKFILGSGKGGQKINKTASCVYLKHLPTGIEVKCQKDRSREMNRYYARRTLCERLERQKEGKRSEQERAIEKLRRQKRRRSRRSKEKMLASKKKNAETKSLRREVRDSLS